jgi:hypothetical protein
MAKRTPRRNGRRRRRTRPTRFHLRRHHCGAPERTIVCESAVGEVLFGSKRRNEHGGFCLTRASVNEIEASRPAASTTGRGGSGPKRVRRLDVYLAPDCGGATVGRCTRRPHPTPTTTRRTPPAEHTSRRVQAAIMEQRPTTSTRSAGSPGSSSDPVHARLYSSGRSASAFSIPRSSTSSASRRSTMARESWSVPISSANRLNVCPRAD